MQFTLWEGDSSGISLLLDNLFDEEQSPNFCSPFKSGTCPKSVFISRNRPPKMPCIFSTAVSIYCLINLFRDCTLSSKGIVAGEKNQVLDMPSGLKQYLFSNHKFLKWVHVSYYNRFATSQALKIQNFVLVVLVEVCCWSFLAAQHIAYKEVLLLKGNDLQIFCN